MENVKKRSKSPFVRGGAAIFKGKTAKMIVRHRMLYLFLLPAIVFVIVFQYIPMASLIMTLQDFKLQEGIFGSEFVGLKWFVATLFDPASDGYIAIKNTMYISVMRILTNFPIILIYVLLLNEIKRRKVRGAIQTISYIPYFISWIAVGGMAFNLLSYDDGILNKIIVRFGGRPIAWYNEPKYWWIILSISSLWKGMGWSTLIYMSGLGSIDDELYDACKIDGGGRFRQAITVTLPGLMHIIMLQLILDVSGIMKDNADQILAMINGSLLLHSTTGTVGTNEFNAITTGSNYAKIAALGFVRGIVGVLLVKIMDKIAKSADSGGIL